MSAGGTVLASLDIPHGARDHLRVRSRRLVRTRKSAPGSPGPSRKPWPITYPRCTSSFEHEANTTANHVLGTPAQFKAAWNHMHRIATQAHLNAGTGGRLRWAMILMHTAYFPASMRPHWWLRLGFASQYFPGAGTWT